MNKTVTMTMTITVMVMVMVMMAMPIVLQALHYVLKTKGDAAALRTAQHFAL